MSQLKRLLAPQFWKVPKKVAKYTVSPRPGPHKKFESIPLQIIVRNILKLVETGKEAKTIINRGEIYVDGKRRKDHAYPAGLFDVVSIPKLNQNYRIVPYAKGLKLISITEDEAKKKICRIINKTVVRKGKLQLNLHDGKNILVDKGDYKTGDSVVLSLPEQKILEHIKIESGSLGIVTKGRNSGLFVKVKEIITTRTREPNKVVCDVNGEKLTLIKDFVTVVGKDKPLITVSE